MSDGSYSANSLNVTPQQRAYLLETIKDWSIAHGLAVRPPPSFVTKDNDPAGVLAMTAPVTLFPSLFPKSCFEEAFEVQTLYNELYAAISSDDQWLEGVMQELIEVDDFVGNLWAIHQKIKQDGIVQPLELGLFRSDYMVHEGRHDGDRDGGSSLQIRQVEFNTISSSFGPLSTLTGELHRLIIEEGPQTEVINRHLNRMFKTLDSDVILPSAELSNATSQLASGLRAAHLAYGDSRNSTKLPLCVLFIVQSGERNIFDQRHLENALFGFPEFADGGGEAQIFRLPFDQTLKRVRTPTNNPARPLLYRPAHEEQDYEVTVVYYRAGYGPADYENPLQSGSTIDANSRTDLQDEQMFLKDGPWKSRLLLERSAAIKCPSIATQLAGTKKVQQLLASPVIESLDSLAHFVPREEARQRLRKTFAAMYPLDQSETGQKGRKLATDRTSCRGFVLKPQREGGGNNVYRDDIPDFLQRLTASGVKEGDGEPEADNARVEAHDKWLAYILMELIEPPSQRNTIFREGRVWGPDEVIVELGVFGTCLWDRRGKKADGLFDVPDNSDDGAGKQDWQRRQKKKVRPQGDHGILWNATAGYLARTKARGSNEGGVAAGFGAIDSLALVDM